ncbi:hypothetical protein [Clostridium sp. KNHs216]|uniref:hypothetical protein n=1 Tax=Clostridium sp. KNHs216 TaxID=1550235 RepID=UPI00114D7A2A|nr:hypothetical protein [Clostridium sp. KNHs216]TQI68588.1 hypothetical protein LY85_3328 [Clostridium sp. KNHs216]
MNEKVFSKENFRTIGYYPNKLEFPEYQLERYMWGTWKTPCGLLINGNQNGTIRASGLSYGGVDYGVEFNRVDFKCPYEGNKSCELREKNLDVMIRWYGTAVCIACLTDDPYDYDHSAEKAEADQNKKNQTFIESFYKAHPEFIGCIRTSVYAEKVRSWRPCSLNTYCEDCRKAVCAITGEHRDLSPVFIYGDYLVHVDNGFLSYDFARKNVKIRNKPYPKYTADKMIAEMELMSNKDFIDNYSKGKPDRIYTLPKGKTRDLEQDLADAKEGYEIIHDSDFQKSTAAKMREAKAIRKAHKQKVKQEPQGEQLKLF